MDQKLSDHVVRLRVQGEHVCELTTALCTTVKQIEHMLSKEDPTMTATNVLVAQLVEMKQELFTETKFLYECLQQFIETTSSANRSTEGD